MITKLLHQMRIACSGPVVSDVENIYLIKLSRTVKYSSQYGLNVNSRAFI